MNTEAPTPLDRIMTLAKIAKTSVHAKTIAAGVVAVLSAGAFLLKTCSDPNPPAGGLTDRAQNVVDQIRDAKNTITPPNEAEIAKDVEDEVQSAQDDDSFFMDDTASE